MQKPQWGIFKSAASFLGYDFWSILRRYRDLPKTELVFAYLYSVKVNIQIAKFELFKNFIISKHYFLILTGGQNKLLCVGLHIVCIH